MKEKTKKTTHSSYDKTAKKALCIAICGSVFFMILWIFLGAYLSYSPLEFGGSNIPAGSSEAENGIDIDVSDMSKEDLKKSVEMLDIQKAEGTSEFEGPAGVGIEKETAMKIIDEQTKEVKTRSNEENIEKLKNLSKRADKYSQSSVKAIGAFLGADSTLNQPKKNPPKGEFSFKSASLEGIEKIYKDKNNEANKNIKENNGIADADKKKVASAKEYGYKVTLVDKDGRTTSFDVWGKNVRQYDAMHSTFQMMEKSPALKAVYHQILKPMLPQMLEQRRKQMKAKRRKAKQDPAPSKK
jgi:hypothetical protein